MEYMDFSSLFKLETSLKTYVFTKIELKCISYIKVQYLERLEPPLF